MRLLLTGGAAALCFAPFGATSAGAEELPAPGPEVVAVDPGSSTSPGDSPLLPEDEAVVSTEESLGDAMEALDDAPSGALKACAEDSPGDPCVRLLPAEGSDEDRPPSGSLHARQASVVTEASPFAAQLGSWSPRCTGSGKDGLRVHTIYAYDASLGPPSDAYMAAIRTAIANVDLTFSQSAAETGGSRRVLFETDNGLPGCQVSLPEVPITTGLADFETLIDQLVALGEVSGDPATGGKYLIWTEGLLKAEVPEACGLGLSYSDDTPGAYDNYNLLTSYAAVKHPCFDIDGGGSVPAHELMHTLGAVQDSAPHYDGNGHCTDDYDNMCYEFSVPVAGCTNKAYGEARFDCNDDDYFNTAPASGSYLCRAWNTARSPYLEGWSSGYAALSGVSALWTVASPGALTVKWSPPTSCPSASSYILSVEGWGSIELRSSVTSYTVWVPPGNRTVTVTPVRDGGLGPATNSVGSSGTEVPNELPTGGIVLSLNRGRDYGLLAWAIDPETGAPPRMRVWVEGVSAGEYHWNYTWADMPAFTGVNDTRSLVFLAQLPSGTRQVCFEALDPQGGGWVNLGCRTHTVK